MEKKSPKNYITLNTIWREKPNQPKKPNSDLKAKF